jgi:hypothetical protein
MSNEPTEDWDELLFLWRQIQNNILALTNILQPCGVPEKFDTLAERINSAYTALQAANSADDLFPFLVEISAATKELSALVLEQSSSGGNHTP